MEKDMKHLDRETEKRLNTVVKAIGTLFILSFLAHLVISSWRDDQYGFTLLALIAGSALVSINLGRRKKGKEDY
ncbi:hypothetical protein C2K18_24250 [Salmonella enterica]|uniref:S008 n=19 Tax=Gammaproteobacteria TaxID=1236 RepID=A0A4P6ZIM8_ECOLX|nr:MULTISPECIES: hypothetical protein [Morganellaceae]AAK38387.1 hypothetical protein [Salmonella enterica subsp. enterica serovar Typhimurium]AIU97963.1 hypothetical protein S008 [Salmonella enterica subsp. enterica]AIZ49186.1 A008 [Acinetobacter baumannii]AMP35641.2 Hypothetical protein [Salmonella enterica]AMZ41386.1 hypothetical protein AX06_00830 [Salmonella enterica subsp. enterica serovar Typhimurium str. CDC 2011K-1702]AMZ46081.1 hypothetical protein AW93_00895 [Salmonella enterica su